jgi:hypothetical protein
MKTMAGVALAVGIRNMTGTTRVNMAMVEVVVMIMPLMGIIIITMGKVSIPI